MKPEPDRPFGGSQAISQSTKPSDARQQPCVCCQQRKAVANEGGKSADGVVASENCYRTSCPSRRLYKLKNWVAPNSYAVRGKGEVCSRLRNDNFYVLRRTRGAPNAPPRKAWNSFSCKQMSTSKCCFRWALKMQRGRAASFVSYGINSRPGALTPRPLTSRTATTSCLRVRARPAGGRWPTNARRQPRD